MKKLIFILFLVSCKKTETASPVILDQGAQIVAATNTASQNSLCTAIQPFYWEIGNSAAKITGASVGSSPPDATSVLQIASASKWIFASYVIEKLNGVLSASIIAGLNFTAGYSGFTSCAAYSTISACYTAVTTFNAADNNKFYYSGGNMQKIAHTATDLNIGSMTAAALSTEVKNYIGSDVPITFNIPQPAGGILASANTYAVFLKKIMNGTLKMSSFLSSNLTCTNVTSCSTSNYTPIPNTEAWTYGLGHWIENDPVTGDNAFSSPGLYGFYPWISADKSLYGILARYNNSSPTAYWDSVQCGRVIRKAFVTGTQQ